MVSLRTLATTAVAFMAAPAIAALTSGQIVDAIKSLTMKSRALQQPANSISIINGPLIIIGQGPFPQLISGFTDIVTTTTTAIAQLQGTPKITATTATMEIADAFRDFVRVHQQLLNILIGKSGLFTIVPFIGQPIAAVLRSVEAVVDQIAFGLVDVVEGAAVGALASDRAALKLTLDTTIEKYEGLSIGPVKKRDGLEAKVFVA
ncbi:hypothetical protein QBC43DRAFT_38663 [Cladorrhinum sp. PSN259]|nr:hypothetical protein QBC43DRAFT_38663 [Cladorrhinum sp. PSN259]